MKIKKFLADKKALKQIRNNIFPLVYENESFVPTKNFSIVVDKTSQNYDKLDSWTEESKLWALDFLIKNFEDFALKKAESSNGITATKLWNIVRSLEYISSVIKSFHLEYEISEKVVDCRLELLKLLYESLLQVKYVAGLEYPFSKVASDFWSYRFKYLQELPYNLLINSNGTKGQIKSSLEYLNSFNDEYSLSDRICKDYPGIENLKLDLEDDPHKMLKTAKLKYKLIQNLSPTHAKELANCILEAKECNLDVDILQIINAYTLTDK
jgi:hypothetical protein